MRKKIFLSAMLALMSVGMHSQGFIVYDGDKSVASYPGTNIRVVMLKDCPVLPSSLTLSGVSSLDIKASAALLATLSPSGATTTLKWSSSDESIATVDQSGTVTGVEVGTVTITATTTDGTQLSATHDITVTSPAVSSGRFSVDYATRVRFTIGNLRATYDGNSYTWSLSPHQYDYIGNGAGNTTIGDSQTSGAVVDLFGWSVNSDETTTPIKSSTNNYGISPSKSDDYYKGGFADWGLMAAFDESGYTLLDKAKWEYLLNTRKVNGGTGSGKSYQHTTLTLKGGTSVSGMLIFPDDYSTSSYPAPGTSTAWTDWEKMEEAGTVFLPDGGSREGTTVTTGSGNYWTKGYEADNTANYMTTTGTVGSQNRYKGCNVRFVVDVPEMSDGKFRVSDTKEVQFTTGNLQATYSDSGYKYSFAAHQYDYIGNAAGNTSIGSSQATDAVVDLFGWSTTDTDCNFGVNTLTDAGTLTGSFYDWGNTTELSGRSYSYVTLSSDEWDYLLNTREVNGGTGDGYSYKQTTLTLKDGTTVEGLLLAPGDNTLSMTAATSWAQWQTLESAGFIFLPMAGSRSGSTVTTDAGGYWSQSGSGTDATYVKLATSPATDTAARTTGYSVRLVKISNTQATGIGLSKTSIILRKIGATRTLTSTVYPDNATNKTVTWSSSDDAIATVSADGTVTAKGEGTCTITAATNDGSGFTASCRVTVEPSVTTSQEFSVSATKKVLFAKSNTYWNGTAWMFESDPWDYETSWDETHVSHLYWSKTLATMYDKSYTETGATSDKFAFDVDSKSSNAVGGSTGYYALTSEEWIYLLNTRKVNGGQAEGSSYIRTTLTLKDNTTVFGVLIFPDDYSTDSYPAPATTTSWADWEKMETADVIFLPAAGNRDGSSISRQDKLGTYWSATPSSTYNCDANRLEFTSSSFTLPVNGYRYIAKSLRLVKDN